MDVEKLYRDHPLKEKARGKKILNLPLIIFGDHFGGSTTKKWNKFGLWLMLLGSLPKHQNRKLQNINYFSSSNIVDIMEMADPMVAELKELESDGCFMYDAFLKEEVLVIAPVISCIADNDFQSDWCSHLGCGANKFCRICDIDKKEQPSVSAVGQQRSKEGTMQAIREIKASVLESDKSRLRTSYGVKEAHNPWWGLQSFNGHSMTPVETLHTILLGSVKDITSFEWTKMNSVNQQHLAAALKAMDWSIFPTRLSENSIGSTNLHGRDYKVIVQCLPFLLHAFIPAERRSIWSLLSQIYKDASADEARPQQLRLNITKLTQALEEKIPSISKKTKLHMLQHLPDDVNEFGPPSCFNTEREEAFIRTVKQQLYYTNHKAASKDICNRMNRKDHMEMILSGGFWFDGTEYRCASIGIVNMVRNISIQNYLYGHAVDDSHLRDPGTLRLMMKNSDINLTSEENVALRKSIQKPLDSATYFRGVVAKTRKLCHIGHSVKAMSSDGQKIYGVVKQCISFESTRLVIINKYNATTAVDNYNCSIYTLTDDMLVITADAVEDKVCFLHCCEKGRCRVLNRVQSTRLEGRDHFVRGLHFVHDFSCKTYRLNIFYSSC